MAKKKKELVISGKEKSPSFLRLERNLNSIGFFSASKVRSTYKRVIETRRQVDGKTYVAKTTIVPSEDYGLPNTSDQDKYFALMHLVNKIKLRDGVVTNPVPFTTADLVGILGLSWNGAICEEIKVWLDRLVATTIKSEGAIYLPHRKKYVSDTFHAFSRVVTAGEELGDGKIADQHYVFLGDWLLDSFNRNYVLPIEMEGYKKLSSPLAKALLPNLQLWLYASRAQGRFEKRYQDICIICDIEVFRFLSSVKRQMKQAMGELQSGGYIKSWDVENTADGKDFKLVLKHGPKFFQDQLMLTGKDDQTKLSSPPSDELPPIYQALVDRQVTPTAARKLCRSLPDEQLATAMDQVEYCDWVIKKNRGRIQNPPGFIVTFIRNNDPVPRDFISSSKADTLRQEDEIRRQSDAREWLLQQEYKSYEDTEVDRLLSLIPESELKDLRIAQFQRVKREYPFMPAEHAKNTAESRIRRNLIEQSSLPSFAEFCKNRDPQMGFQF